MTKLKELIFKVMYIAHFKEDCGFTVKGILYYLKCSDAHHQVIPIDCSLPKLIRMRLILKAADSFLAFNEIWWDWNEISHTQPLPMTSSCNFMVY